MKWLIAFTFILLPLAASASGSPASSPPAAVKPLRGAAPPNVTIIDGKKFYSLNNARRFTGSTNSPSALMVIHHPHSPETIITHRSTLAAAPPSGRTAPENTPGSGTAQPSDVLSVFAPDDKTAPVPPALDATKQ